MKQGWEIKKLGEVCEIQGGSTPKRTESLFWENGTYPWFTVEDIREQGRIITDTKQKVTKIAWDKLRVFPKDTILLCCTASLGEYAITKIPLTSNQQFNGLVIKDKKYLSPMFLMHYCATLKNKLYSLSGKATIDFVSAEKVRQIPIPIPPLLEQEKIVAELDCLSGIIEKKKQQLKEYDALAQSIFHEMFGNPIDNEKGWEREQLGNLGEIIAGSTPSTTDETNWGGDINWVTPAELDVQLYYGETVRKITEKASKSLTLMPIGTVLLSSRAPIGKIAITTVPMCCNQGFKNIICGDRVNNVFLYYYLMLTMDDIQALGRGATFKEVSKKSICDYKIFVPTIALQQEFASKIEAIEKQKELIKQSIAETETLFNSRMDFYFG